MNKQDNGFYIGLVEDKIDIVEFLIVNTKRVKKWKLPFGYATVRVREEYKCYFAIQVEKKLMSKIDEETDAMLMGEHFFFLEYDDNSILYLRTKIPLNFIKFNNNQQKHNNKFLEALERG